MDYEVYESKQLVEINSYGKKRMVKISIEHFSDNGLVALVGICENGEPFDTFSVNLGDTYEENVTPIRHYFDDLLKADIIKFPKEKILYGYNNEAYLCEINMDAFNKII